LHQNGPHILRKISALWSCVWCFFTAGAKSDDPLSHPHYGATQNGLPKIRTGVQVLYCVKVNTDRPVTTVAVV